MTSLNQCDICITEPQWTPQQNNNLDFTAFWSPQKSFHPFHLHHLPHPGPPRPLRWPRLSMLSAAVRNAKTPYRAGLRGYRKNCIYQWSWNSDTTFVNGLWVPLLRPSLWYHIGLYWIKLKRIPQSPNAWKRPESIKSISNERRWVVEKPSRFTIIYQHRLHLLHRWSKKNDSFEGYGSNFEVQKKTAKFVILGVGIPIIWQNHLKP